MGLYFCMENRLSDEILIQKFAQGDIHAFKELVERYESLAINVAYRFVGNRQDAEDMAQEAFLRVYHKIDSYQPIAPFKAWFLRILAHLCLDFHKKKRPQIQEEFSKVPSNTPSPRDEVIFSEEQRIIQQAVQDLKESQKMALILCYYQGLRYQEIAQTMECSVKAVESLLIRAKRNLKKRLAGLI